MEHFVGRVSRFLIGLLFTFASILSFLGSFVSVGLTFIGIGIFYSIVHYYIQKNPELFHRYAASAFVVLPLLLVFILGGFVGATASILYLGISLMVAGYKSNLGCEVLPIQSLYFGETHLQAVFFRPVDWLERVYLK